VTQSVPTSELARYRRHFHSHPELSLQERETASFIERELRDAGFSEIRTGIGTTGILATLTGAKPGPVTLLRADMDGLPVTELNEVEYRSVSPGVMHACGHDGHMAILLSAARELMRRRDEVGGQIVFCFQPGEEGYAGNKLMIDDGAMENPHVDRTFALHLYTGLDAGKIGVRDDAFFPSSDRFEIELIGKGRPRRDAPRCGRSDRGCGTARNPAADDRQPRGRAASAGRRYRRLVALGHDVQRDSRARGATRNGSRL